MTEPAPDDALDFALGAAACLDRTLRADRGRILAALIARLRDFQLAEDALHDAAASALIHWAREVPDRPEAWLIRVAFRKAIDRLRRTTRDAAQAKSMAILATDEASEDPELIPDERLRLIFTCCHPALEPKSQVALTLRTLGGLSTADIARAFLDAEPTMGQRLSRAKAKIAAAGIPFAIPGPELWAERLESVLAVIYLIFNQGHGNVMSGTAAAPDLCAEAIFLGRILSGLLPDEPEVQGLLSLMLSTEARRPARRDAAGAMVPLDQQDRSLWRGDLIAEALAALDRAMLSHSPGPYQIKAAISALHGQAAGYSGTDWRQMILLYDALLRLEPSPVVRLNRAVALAEAGAGGLAAAMAEMHDIATHLGSYQPYYATLAELLTRSGDPDGATHAYDKAIALSTATPEQAFLAHRRSLLGTGEKKGRA